MTPVFDGHNDALLRLVSCADPVAAFRDCGGAGHLDLRLARAGGLVGGLFACFVPPDGERDAGFARTRDGYAVAMPEPPTLAWARRRTEDMIACAHGLAAALPGDVRLCRTLSDIRRSLADGVLAMVLHLEGAEAVGPDLDGLEHLPQARECGRSGRSGAAPTGSGRACRSATPAAPTSGRG